MSHERFSRAALLVLSAYVGVCGNALLAQNGAKAPDLAGFWERRDDTGSGSFGGTLEKIPRASIRPEIMKANQEAAARATRGEVVSFGSKWCATNSYPFFMQHSAAWDLFQSQDEVVLVPEVHTFARHIYMDGRKHPDAAHLLHTVNGHAVGRWEDDVLVVDTVGFSGGGGTPGGGRVGKDTHLVERFRLIEGGKKLSVTYTWDDPAIYLKPHTYELQYYRSEPGTYAFEEYCHADDPLQSGSVVPPVQQ